MVQAVLSYKVILYKELLIWVLYSVKSSTNERKKARMHLHKRLFFVKEMQVLYKMQSL